MAPRDASGGYYPPNGGYPSGGYRAPVDPNYDPNQVLANSESQAVNQEQARYDNEFFAKKWFDDADTEGARQRGRAAGQQELAAHSAQLAASMDTRPGPPLTAMNYQAMSHQDLYNAVHVNMDPGGIGDASHAWTKLGELLGTMSQQMSEASNSSASGWTGAAADNARALHSAAAQWSANASNGAQLAATNLAAQSAAAQTAQTSVPPPRNFSFWDGVKDLAAAGISPVLGASMLTGQLTEQSAAHTAAAQAVQAYDQNLGQSSQEMPAVSSPPVMGSAGGSAGGTGLGGGGGYGSGGGGYGSAGGAPHMPSPNVPNMPNAGTTAQGAGAYSGAPASAPWQGGGLANSAVSDPSGGYGGLPMGGYSATGAGGYGVGGAGGARAGYGASGMGGAPSGARSGVGAPSASSAEYGAMNGGAAGARGAAGQPGMGGPMGAARKRGGEDIEHRHASYLIEPDTNSIFGTDQKTVPPVIGG